LFIHFPLLVISIFIIISERTILNFRRTWVNFSQISWVLLLKFGFIFLSQIAIFAKLIVIISELTEGQYDFS